MPQIDFGGHEPPRGGLRLDWWRLQRVCTGILRGGRTPFLGSTRGCGVNWWKKAAAFGAGVLIRAASGSWASAWMAGLGTPEKTLRKPYAESAWVMRAIKMVAEPVAAARLEFYLDGPKGKADTLLTDGPAVEFWEDPWEGMALEEGIEATVSWLKLSGNVFWIKDDSWLAGSRKQSKLIVARPNRMMPVRDGRVLVGWRWMDDGNRSHLLMPWHVEHIKMWNPYDDALGLAEWEAARMATEADYFAGRYLRDLMAAGGDQGDIVTTEGVPPTPEQKDQMTAVLKERHRARMRGEFLPVFLSGAAKVQTSAVQTPDADYVASRLGNRHEIFIALGVPPSFADVKASYSIGADSDYARLIEQTCMPAGVKIAGAIQRLARRQDGRRIYAWFNWDENSTVQESRRGRVDTGTKYWDRGMPWSTISEVLDLGLKSFPGWDRGYVPFSASLVEENGTDRTDATNDADYAENPESEATLEKLLRAYGSRKKADPAAGLKAEGCGCGTGAVSAKAKGTKAQLWKSHMLRRRETVKMFESKFRRALQDARAEVLAKIQKAERDELVQQVAGGKLRAAAADFTFDLGKWKKGMQVLMRKAAEVALQLAGKQMLEELSKDDVFTMPPAKALAFLADRENKLSDIADDVHRQIEESLQEGLLKGESMSKLADRVRGEFNEMGKARATRIAMTETAAAYGTAREAAMVQAGVQFKIWLTSGNDNVRATHAAAQGQVRRVDEAFDVGGAQLQFPGDPDGPAEEIINCHCVQLAATQAEYDAQNNSTGDDQ
jgi:SPP1 gp7 family putative phage head morphogenesis protein